MGRLEEIGMRHQLQIEVVAGVILVALACSASAHQSGQLDVSDLGDAGVFQTAISVDKCRACMAFIDTIVKKTNEMHPSKPTQNSTATPTSTAAKRKEDFETSLARHCKVEACPEQCVQGGAGQTWGCKTTGVGHPDVLTMHLTNPGQDGAQYVKAKTCNAQACQGDPLKPNPYAQCGCSDDRILSGTSQLIQFNSNITYIVFSNGPRRVGVLDPVAVFEFWKPKTGWPTSHEITLPGTLPPDWGQSDWDCKTDGAQYLTMKLTNPGQKGAKAVKVQACDAEACGKAKPYIQCGGPDDRIAENADQVIHFNSNTVYFAFSNGQREVEFWKPKTGSWPTSHQIALNEELGESVQSLGKPQHAQIKKLLDKPIRADGQRLGASVGGRSGQCIPKWEKQLCEMVIPLKNILSTPMSNGKPKPVHEMCEEMTNTTKGICRVKLPQGHLLQWSDILPQGAHHKKDIFHKALDLLSDDFDKF